VATGYGAGARNISVHQDILSRGNIRAGGPDAQGCSINTEQHRRGQGTLHAQGAHILLLNARGSLLELETHAMIAEKLGYLSKGDATELASRSAEIGRLLNGLIYRFKEAATRD